jgi:hypothetical protein
LTRREAAHIIQTEDDAAEGRKQAMRHSARGRLAYGWLIGIAAIALVNCGGNSTSNITNKPRPISRPAYHFSLTIPAGWDIVQEKNDAGAPSPYVISIAPTKGSTSSTTSHFELDVLKLGVPGADLPTAGSGFTATTIGGQSGYSMTQVYPLSPPTSASDQSPIPITTPVAGDPGTLTHTLYEVLTQHFMYEISTEVIANDGSDTAVQALIDSIVIQS